MNKTAYFSGATLALLLAAACGGGTYTLDGPGDADDDATSSSSSGGGGRDGGGSSSSSGDAGGSSSGGRDAGPDASEPDADAPDGSTLRRVITVDVQAEYDADAPGAPSSLGYASSEQPYDTASWRFTPTTSASSTQKFEFYVQLTAPGNGEVVSSAIAQVHEHLGDVTLADLASVKVHTRRNQAGVHPDFTMLVYTDPDGVDDDASWFGRRLHAELDNVVGKNAPAETWNEFATDAAENGLQFWDYRNANSAAGEQPNNNYFTLAQMHQGPITPAGLADARDYRTEKIKYLTFSSYSDAVDFDASIDGIELTLQNGKSVVLDLTGDPKVRRFSVSHATVSASEPPSVGSSYGAPESQDAFTAGSSWHFLRSGAGDKFEFYVPFSMDAAAPAPGAAWDDVRDMLGEFTVNDIDSVQVHTRRNTASSADFSMLIYTRPEAGAVDNDRSWYRRKLTAITVTGAPLAENTWNLQTTGAGNQMQFWDFKGVDADPAGTPFTLADMQAGTVAATARDYRTEVVKWINFSTFTTQTDVDARIDAIQIKLKDGRAAILDLNQ